jgi:hypothetical protein
MTTDTMTTAELLAAARALLLPKQPRRSASSTVTWRPRQSAARSGTMEVKDAHFRRHYTEAETRTLGGAWHRVGEDAWLRVR